VKALNRRFFIKSCAAGAATAALPALRGAQSAPPAKRLNILSIAVDDLRPELGCYGASVARSPNLDRFARSGIVLQSAYCQQAVCAPSRASLLSGARPDSTKVLDLYTNFRVALPGIESLPEFFKNRGYFAEGFGKVFHIDDVQSWSTSHPARAFGPGNPAPTAPYANPDLNRANATAFERAKAAGLTGTALERSARGPAYEIADVADETLPDGITATRGIEALRSLAESKHPFFLALGFLKPHLPFVAPRRYWDLYDPATIPLAANPRHPRGAPSYAFDSGEFYAFAGVPRERPIPDDYARIARQGYFAGVSFVDAQIGRVLDALERLGLADNTIVVVWADHGFKLGEHGEWAKLTNYEEDTRVPLMIRVPGLSTSGGQRAGLVESVDIYPTLVELAGFAAPKHLEGISFVPLLREPRRTWKPAVFSQYPRIVDGRALMGRALRTERYRFVQWARVDEPRKVEAVELYDHERDPGENVNMAGEPAYAKAVADCTARLRAGWKYSRPAA
jgi:iduronate 2-sulfatase